jgi:hypothetical protein
MRSLHTRSDGGQYLSWLYDHLRGFFSGNVLFVHSAGGEFSSAAGPGYSPRQAYLTMEQATDSAVANNNDCVCVLSGHTETVTAAGGLTLDKEGVTYIGLGNGRARPKVNFTTAATASVLVTAANVTMCGPAPGVGGFYFDLTSVDGLDNPIHVQAADFSLLDSELELADSGGQADLAILTTAAANRLTVERCRFLGTGDAGTAAAVRIVGGDGIVIEDNLFIGAYTTTLGAVEGNTTLTTNIAIHKNRIYNRTASSTKAIVLLTGSTGVISENRMQILSGTAPITADAAAWLGNRYVASIGAPDVEL